MKHITLIILLTIASLSAVAAPKAPKSSNDTIITVTVEPAMHCANCEKKIKSNIRFEKGVKSIETNINDQTVTIKADKSKINIKRLEKAFAKIGYKIKNK